MWIKRLIKWMFPNVVFALIPLVIVVVIRGLTGTLSAETMRDNLNEILFFSLMISIISFSDIDAELFIPTNIKTVMLFIKWFLLFGAIWSAILYGFFMYDLVLEINNASMREKLLGVAMLSGLVLFMVSISVQIFLGQVIPE